MIKTKILNIYLKNKETNRNDKKPENAMICGTICFLR